jgi:hypothetical protein
VMDGGDSPGRRQEDGVGEELQRTPCSHGATSLGVARLDR